MTLQFNNSIVFTENEYESWFCMGRNNILLADLRKLIVNKGVPSKNINKVNFCDIENFVFNSIVRKTAPMHLFTVYKRLVARISYSTIIAYVKTRRYHGDAITHEYNPYVTGIIIASTIDQQEEQRRFIEDYHENAQTRYNILRHTKTGREFLIKHSNNISKCDLFSCPRVSFFAGASCDCCVHKMLLFVNECIINLGYKLLVSDTYNFLLFSFGMKNNGMIKDVIVRVGFSVIDIL